MTLRLKLSKTIFDIEKLWSIPSVTNDTDVKSFCPQPCLPPQPVEGEPTLSSVVDVPIVNHMENDVSLDSKHCLTKPCSKSQPQTNTRRDSYTQYEPCLEEHKKQCCTQFPSLNESVPTSCNIRRVRNSWTQCNKVCNRDPYNEQKAKSSQHSKNADYVACCDRSMACDQRLSGREMKKECGLASSVCFRMCNNQKNVTPNACGEVFSIVDNCWSELQTKMACNRKFLTTPSTSYRGSDSLTDIVNKAVLSIQSLKASLGDLKTSDN